MTEAPPRFALRAILILGLFVYAVFAALATTLG
jgi:hypothetical protein